MDQALSIDILRRRGRQRLAAGMLAFAFLAFLACAAWGLNRVLRPSVAGADVAIAEVRRGAVDTTVDAAGVVVGRYQPVGASTSSQADVRVVSATNRELAELVAAGEFREDLFYRLNLITIRLPPLRERRSDIGLLARHIAARVAFDYGLGLERHGLGAGIAIEDRLSDGFGA
ncbi:sigma 54-interacting transcriptional regulator [Massilia sp. 9096]|uniref:sigma 54-interacting transcriptional regulator n=1 Tax=Massilia sp. 9096 TaxID=1500894 RepID=UPI00055BB703|nr:sigma 54-interacting transcriptional regulator [Massilia sp. 9096]